MIEKKYVIFLCNSNKSYITIADGNKIINKIEMETPHNNIYLDENNNIYFINYKTNKIVSIDKQYKINKVWNIHNNGKINVDLQNHKIYVCDTAKVWVYDLTNGDKIGSISGFSAASCIELDKTRKIIFILDILKKELKSFDTSNLKLISKYENLGNSPFKFCIGQNGKYIYVANKGGLTEKYKSNIFILDSVNGENIEIDFEKKSLITSMELCGKFLYIINAGLNKLQVIDILNERNIDIVNTTFKKPKIFCASPDKTILLVVSKSDDNRVAIDVLDTTTKVIKDTFFSEIIDENTLNMIITCREIKNLTLEEKNVDGEKQISEDNETFEIRDLKNYFKRILSEFEKIKLVQIENQKEIAWQKEKVDYYKKDNDKLREQNNYYKKKLFKADKEKIIIEEKLAEKSRIIKEHRNFSRYVDNP